MSEQKIKVQFETDSHCPVCGCIDFLQYGEKPYHAVRCMSCCNDFDLNEDKTYWVLSGQFKNKAGVEINNN